MKKYYFKISGKEFLLLLLLWLLIFIEPITIGSVKISQIWKLVVVVWIFLFVVKRKFPTFIWIGILFSFKFLVYTHLPYGYLRALQDALEALILPILLAFFYIKYYGRPSLVANLLHTSILFSLFMIYSSIPFLFGLESLNPVHDLDDFGVDNNAVNGLFYSVSASSKVFTVATVVIFNTYKQFSNSMVNKLVWLSSVIFGSYLVFASWTRTGWFIFIIALVVSLFYGGSFKRKIIAIIGGTLIVLGVTWVYQTNEAFRWRISGGSISKTNKELSIEQLAEARLPFIIIAIDNLIDEGLEGQLLGYGTQRSMDLFENKFGVGIVSHNRTFEILESSGVIGLVIYLIFLYHLFKRIHRNFTYYNQELRRIVIVSLLMFILFFLTSHGSLLWTDIIFVPIFLIFLFPRIVWHYK